MNTAKHQFQQESAESPPAGPKIYYGWIVVGACVVALVATHGIYYSFGVFFNALKTEFSWSRAQTSSIFSIYLIFAGIFSVAGGQALDRFGPRIVVVIMGVITGLSLFLISRVTAAWQMILFYSILLAMGTGATYIVLVGTVSGWFSRKRGTAVGMVGAGAGLGAVIMSPFSAWLIETYHWRQAYLVVGLISMGIIVSMGLLIKAPPDVPSEPGTQNGLKNKAETDSTITVRGYSLSEAVVTLNFWLLFIVLFSYSFCMHMVISHVVPCAEDAGMPALRAASIMSLLTGTMIPCRLISGIIADRFDKRLLLVVLALAHLFAMAWLSQAGSAWMFFVFGLVYGMIHGAIDPPAMALIGDAFGMLRLGSIMGLLMIAWGLGSASGPYFAGMVFDATGTYTIAFLTAGILMGLTALCSLRIRIISNQ